MDTRRRHVDMPSTKPSKTYGDQGSLSTGAAWAYSCLGVDGGPSKEDRAVVILDLKKFVHENYKNYSADRFGDTLPPVPPATFPKDRRGSGLVDPPSPVRKTKSGFLDGLDQPITTPPQETYRLFAVFDGHCGSIASTFCQQRLPFELVATKEFQDGDFEKALEKTFENLHKNLLACGKYAPEAPQNDFSSGCTASVVLTSPHRTYFAMVGDSPILVWLKKDTFPNILFKEHDVDNRDIHQRFLASKLFMVVSKEAFMQNMHFLVTGAKMRRRLLRTMNKNHQEDIKSRAAENEALVEEILKDEEKRNALVPRRSARQAIRKGSVDGDDDMVDDQEDLEPPEPDGMRKMDENRGRDKSPAPSPRPPGQWPQAETPGVRQTRSNSLSHSPGKRRPSNPSPGHQSDGGSDSADSDYDDEMMQFDDVRIGMSALNVWGSIGDSSYDEEVLNEFIDLLEEYRRLRTARFQECKERLAKGLIQTKKKIKRKVSDGEEDSQVDVPVPISRKRTRSADIDSNRKDGVDSESAHSSSILPREGPPFVFDFERDPNLLEHYKGHEMPYKDLRAFMISRPRWDQFLRKHFSLLARESQMSRVLLAAILNLTHEHKIKDSGLIRKPNVTSIANSDMKMFILASDGVVRWYERDKPRYDKVILEHRDNVKTLVSSMMENMAWLRDDRTCIAVKFEEEDR